MSTFIDTFCCCFQTQLQKASGSSSKRTRLTGVAKLEDANDAGGKNSQDCTLILTEGDSAKTLAVSGLGMQDTCKLSNAIWLRPLFTYIDIVACF